MNYQSVLELIDSSKLPGENSNDIFTMVHLVEPFIPTRHDLLEGWLDSFPAARDHEELKAKVGAIAGSILCLLWAPVKQQSYIASMTSVREQYKGIAEQAMLQAQFANGLEVAEKADAFTGYAGASQILPQSLSDSSPSAAPFVSA